MQKPPFHVTKTFAPVIIVAIAILALSNDAAAAPISLNFQHGYGKSASVIKIYGKLNAEARWDFSEHWENRLVRLTFKVEVIAEAANSADSIASGS